MKKVILSSLFTLLLGAFSAQSAFAGLYQTGFVNVVNATTYSYMAGTMNSRHNTSTNSYIQGYGYANSAVYFSGRNDAGTLTFNCFVPTTSALHADAQEIKNNMKNGSYVYLYRTSASNECTSVYMLNTSRFMH